MNGTSCSQGLAWEIFVKGVRTFFAGVDDDDDDDDNGADACPRRRGLFCSTVMVVCDAAEGSECSRDSDGRGLLETQSGTAGAQSGLGLCCPLERKAARRSPTR